MLNIFLKESKGIFKKSLKLTLERSVGHKEPALTAVLKINLSSSLNLYPSGYKYFVQNRNKFLRQRERVFVLPMV